MYEFQSEWNTFMTKTSANKWRADVDRLTKCDSIYHRKNAENVKKIKIQYVVNIFHTFRARPVSGWDELRSLEQLLNPSKIIQSQVLWKILRQFIDFWHLYETWNVMYEFVRWKLCYLPNYLFFQIEKTDYLRIFIPSLTYL